MSVVKYTENYASLGNYRVDEQYRGRGYGILTWKAAMSSINEDCNTAAYVAAEKVPMFQRVGLQPKWYEQHFDIDLVASQASFALSRTQSPPAVTIQPACEVDFE